MPVTAQHTDEVAVSLQGQLVIAENQSDQPFVDVYDSKRYEIPPGQRLTVPIEAMWDWAGRPWVVDRDHHRERSEELARLKHRYGVFACPELEQSEDDNWQANVPKLTFVSLDGEPQVTVLDDPYGNGVTPADMTVGEQKLLADRYDELQRQIRALEAALANQETRGYIPTSEQAPEDSPGKIPVKASDPPEVVGERRRGREPRPPRT